MDKLRPMPIREQYEHAFGMVCAYQKHVLPFVEQRLGYAARHELEAVWRAAIAQIREQYPDEVKYQRAYTSWLWMARCSHDFVADQLDREGVADYKRLLLQLYKHQADNPDLVIYQLLNRFTRLAKEWAYEMQWMTPLEITYDGAGVVVCEVHRCKVLQTAATERVCKVDCWNVGTALARQECHLERRTQQLNHGCTITLTSIEG